ncbi:hypothetical protein ACFFWC_05185 [Plantactinospora siamensis]|uniref:Uncharacterized protein n=1 Tax=Plantactinospora siamensis TaxID=555372 RepID=A0ABV6NRK1_9ACTN
MKNYQSDWTEEQSAVYDESYGIGQDWANDPGTPSEDLQQVINLAEADEADLDGMELRYEPLVEAVSDATGRVVESVPATRDDPAFAGFVEGARDAASDDTFGL